MTPLFGCSEHPFYDFYAANLRAGLFTGFLTLAGFLLTALALTVIQIKKELGDRPLYLEEIKGKRRADALKVPGFLGVPSPGRCCPNPPVGVAL